MLACHVLCSPFSLYGLRLLCGRCALPLGCAPAAVAGGSVPAWGMARWSRSNSTAGRLVLVDRLQRVGGVAVLAALERPVGVEQDGHVVVGVVAPEHAHAGARVLAQLLEGAPQRVHPRHRLRVLPPLWAEHAGLPAGRAAVHLQKPAGELAQRAVVADRRRLGGLARRLSVGLAGLAVGPGRHVAGDVVAVDGRRVVPVSHAPPRSSGQCAPLQPRFAIVPSGRGSRLRLRRGRVGSRCIGPRRTKRESATHARAPRRSAASRGSARLRRGAGWSGRCSRRRRARPACR